MGDWVIHLSLIDAQGRVLLLLLYVCCHEVCLLCHIALQGQDCCVSTWLMRLLEATSQQAKLGYKWHVQYTLAREPNLPGQCMQASSSKSLDSVVQSVWISSM